MHVGWAGCSRASFTGGRACGYLGKPIWVIARILQMKKHTSAGPKGAEEGQTRCSTAAVMACKFSAWLCNIGMSVCSMPQSNSSGNLSLSSGDGQNARANAPSRGRALASAGLAGNHRGSLVQ